MVILLGIRAIRLQKGKLYTHKEVDFYKKVDKRAIIVSTIVERAINA